MPDQAAETEVIETTEAPRVDTFDYGTLANSAEPETQVEAQADGGEQAPAVPEQELAPDTTEDVEFEGKQYKLDRVLKEALMRQSDYTKKTQEIAETRRVLEARQAQIEQLAQLHQDSVQENAQLYSIDTQLAEYAKIDWDASSNTDPVETQKAFIRQQNLQNARESLVQTMQQKQYQQAQIRNQQAFEAQHATAKQIEEGMAILKRDIKEWSPELASKLKQHAVDDGWTPEQINAVTPAQIKSLHRAYVGQQLIQKQPAAQPVKPPPPPVPKVGGGGAATAKSYSDMTMEEYAKARRAQRR